MNFFKQMLGFWLVLGHWLSLDAQYALDYYIEEAYASNQQLRSLVFDYEKSITELKKARSNFFPTISFESRYTLAGGGRMINLPVGDLLNPVYNTLNEITQSQNFPNIENVNEQFLPNNFHENYLSLQQPIFNTDIYFAYKAQKELVAVETAKRAAYQNQLKKEVATAYFNYLRAKDAIQIYQEAEVVLQAALDLNQTLFKNNKITYDEVLNTRADLRAIQRDQLDAQNKQRLAQSYLNFLIDQPLETPIKVGEAPLLLPNLTDSLNNLQTLALQNRQEFKQLEAARRANQQLVDLHKYSNVFPKVFVGAQAGFQGFGYSFDGTQDYALLQVGLTWTIFEGGKQKAMKEAYRLETSKIDLQHQQIAQQIRLETQQAYEGVQTAQASYEVARSEINALEEALRIIKSRYENNRAIQLEYLTAQTAYTQARINENLLKYNILIQQVALDAAINQ